jgi:hypothetical protein
MSISSAFKKQFEGQEVFLQVFCLNLFAPADFQVSLSEVVNMPECVF